MPRSCHGGRLLDDPVPRVSHESRFIQLADVVAYAAGKAIVPGGSRSARICPPTTWSLLGGGCYAVVNSTKPHQVPGIVLG